MTTQPLLAQNDTLFVDYTLSLTINNLNFHFIDSVSSSPGGMGGGKDTAYSIEYEDTFSVFILSQKASSSKTFKNYRLNDTLFFSYDNTSVYDPSNEYGWSRTIHLKMILDTVLHLVKELTFESDTSSSYNGHWASNPYNTDYTSYLFTLSNFSYVSSSDGSFDIMMQGNQLSQSLVSFDNNWGNSNGSDVDERNDSHATGKIILPLSSDAQIHISLKK